MEKFQPFNLQEGVLKGRRRLPHWEQEQKTYFVTFRLTDSMPQSYLNRLKQEKDELLRLNPESINKQKKNEIRNIFTQKQQNWLDKGYGSCILKELKNSSIVQRALLYFDGERYLLGSYVIMPNHAHLIVTPLGNYDLTSILHSWKSYSAKEINRLTNRKGALWQDESFDHIIRSFEQLAYFEKYIEENPRKARLKLEEYCVGIGKWGKQGLVNNSKI